MAAVNITVKLNQGKAPRQFALELDPQFFSQRIMLDYLTQQKMYEPETMAMLELILEPGDTFIDVGGHVGLFSMFAAGLVGPSGAVFAFEPERANYEHLIKHIAMNNFHHVFACNWAVGKNTGVTELFFNADNDGGHALWDPGRYPFNQKARAQISKQPVLLVSLDEFFRNAQPGQAKLIKMDTEGNEVNVLRGARKFLASAQVGAVIAEVNRFALQELGCTEQEMRTLMTELGYATYFLSEQRPIPLAANQFVDSQTVFNLLFARPEIQRLIDSRWPPAAAR